MAAFVVTGTGRCGTAHCFKVLHLLGVPASHEHFFEAGRRGFTGDDREAYKASPVNDVSLYAAPFLRDVGVPSIHLVRDPVDTVNSFLHLRLPLSSEHELSEFIRHWIKPEGETDAEMWVDYWEKCNRICAEAATVTVRVEALSKGEVDEDALISITGAAGFLPKWRELPQMKNRIHRVDTNLVPEHLLPRLRRAGEAYGYA